MKKIKNLTPHGVSIVDNEGNVAVTFPSEGVIRLSQSTERVGSLSVENGDIECPRCEDGGGLEKDSQNPVAVCSLCGYEDRFEIPISRTSYGGADQLPPKKKDTIYIVSSMVCQACPDREDFYIPNETVRDNEGRIIGCKSLSKNPFYTGSDEEVVE